MYYAMATDPQTLESLRAVSAQVVNEIDRRGLVSLAICSVAAGEGRTTLASHLADAISRIGRTVLLVDLDLRPGSSKGSATKTGGLGSYTAGGTLTASVTKRSDTLAVLEAGELANNPGRIIDTGLTTRILSDAAGNYDLVIVDTPPLMESNDAATIAGQAGACLFVMAAGQTTATLLEQAVAIISRFQALPIGVVLNKFSGQGLLHDRESVRLADLAPLIRRAWRRVRFSPK